MLEYALCRVAVSLLFNYIMGLDIISNWRIFPLPNTVKQKTCKFTLQAMLIGHAKWEQVRLLESTQCRTEAGVLEV